jgi:hypothetical protein
MVQGKTVIVPPDPLPHCPPQIPHALAWIEPGSPR